MLSTLVADPIPMVRRAFFAPFREMAAVFEPIALKTEPAQWFPTIAKDEQDSVRFLAMEDAVALIPLAAGAEDIAGDVVLVIRNIAADKGWRVRYMVADHFAAFVDAILRWKPMKDKDLMAEWMSIFGNVLRDSEAEFQTAAGHWESDDVVVLELIPILKILAGDTNVSVRSALAHTIGGFSGGVLSKEKVLGHILPNVFALLKDDSSEVRLDMMRSWAGNSGNGTNSLLGRECPHLCRKGPADDRTADQDGGCAGADQAGAAAAARGQRYRRQVV